MNWDWNVDLMSYMQIEDLIKSEGYHNIKCLWYWNHEFSFTRGLQPLNNDNDVLRLVEDVKGYKVIDAYVEHKFEEVYIEEFEGVNVEGNDEDDKVEEVNVKGNVEDDKVEEVNVEGNDEDDKVEGVNVEGNDEDDMVEESNVEVNDEDDKVEEVNIEGNDEDDMVEESNVEGNDEDGNEKENVEEGNEKANVEEGNEKENIEDSNEEREKDIDYNMSNEDDNEDKDDAEDDIDELNLGPDVGVDWTSVLPTDMIEQPSRADDYSNND